MKVSLSTKTAVDEQFEQGILPGLSVYTGSGRSSLVARLALCVLAVALCAPHSLAAQNRIETRALTERDRSLLKSDTITLRGQSVAVVRRSGSSAADYILKPRGGGPLAVTFNECNNAAKETCGSGVQDVSYDDHGDDKPSTGDCSYSCFAAPGPSD